MTEPQPPILTEPPRRPAPETGQTAPATKTTALTFILSLLALIIALTAGGLYLAGKRQAGHLQTANVRLNEQLNALQSRQQQLQSQLNALTQQQQQTDAASQQHDQALTHQIQKLEQKMARISDTDINHWLLAQADFLVKMAGRKLWIDQDTLSARALLKSADTSLADINDPGLIPVRRALAADMATLAALNQTDYDGITLQLNQLANQLDNLRLADSAAPATPASDAPLSASLRQWRQNLAKSWHNFLDGFLTIRRRDTTDIPLLAPDQEIYLRENLRARLLIAAQAIPRHQQEIYQQSLEEVASWIRAYYNTSDAASKAFLASLEHLIQQPITMTLPDALQSQPLLDKLVQTRLHSLAPQQEPPSPAQQNAQQPDAPASQHQQNPPGSPQDTPHQQNASPHPDNTPGHPQQNTAPQPPAPTVPPPQDSPTPAGENLSHTHQQIVSQPPAQPAPHPKHASQPQQPVVSHQSDHPAPWQQRNATPPDTPAPPLRTIAPPLFSSAGAFPWRHHAPASRPRHSRETPRHA